jgi:hypothetical protein
VRVNLRLLYQHDPAEYTLWKENPLRYGRASPGMYQYYLSRHDTTYVIEHDTNQHNGTDNPSIDRYSGRAPECYLSKPHSLSCAVDMASRLEHDGQCLDTSSQYWA